MILYHGSNIEIDRIDLEKCNPYKDFGKGFYLTPLRSQAENMAYRRTRITGEGQPVISAFSFDDSILDAGSLKVKIFPEPSVEWANFVLNNRDIQRVGFQHSYDIVVGPVADDTVAFQLRRYLLGVIPLELLVKELSYKSLNSQYYFGTEAAISKLIRIYE